MVVLDFVIPLDKDQLLRSQAGKYYVKELVPMRMLPQAIDVCRSALQSCGPSFILDHFDTFFSVIIHGNNLELPIIMRAFDRINKSVGNLVEELEKAFDQGKEPETEDKPRLLSVNKMTAYLYSWFIRHIEGRINKDANGIESKRKKSAKKSDAEADWEAKSQNSLELIYRWLYLPLHKLWQPPIVEDAFVTVLAEVCYKVLEQCKEARQKHVRETIFQILGILVKRYNHGITCVVKIIQLLKLYDSLALPLAAGVVQLVEETGSTGLVRELVREIGRGDAGEGGARNISMFLEAIASSKPNLMLPIISSITDQLANENYMMRNCVIGILGVVVEGALTGEGLTEEQREKRDECLDNLEEHILDCNAYVRSKVLQVWQHLCCEGAVPLARQGTLLGSTALRLEDKSASVRKYALQLLRALLQSNPFAAKLDQEELARQLEEANSKLADLKKRYASVSAPGADERLELWNARIPEIEKAIKHVLENEDSEGSEEYRDNTDAAFEEVRQLLLSENIQEAVTLMRKLNEKLPGAPALDSISQENKGEYLLVCLLKVFMESENGEIQGEKDNSNVKIKQKQKDEVEAQKRLVDYLENCSEFAKELGKAIPMAEYLLFSTTASDAIESCTFLGTASQFGVAGAMKGVRKALFQVFCRDQSVYDNVAKVYKQLYLGADMEHQSERQKALVSVKALTGLLKGLEPGQSPALAQMVTAWRANKELGPEALQVMWERFSMKLVNTTPEESRAALILITMAAEAEPGIVSGNNLDVLVKVGLGPRAKTDLLLARDTCRALLKVRHEKPDSLKVRLWYPNEHEMFKEIVTLLIDKFTDLEDDCYGSFATDAINAIYHLADQPNLLVNGILCKMAVKGNLCLEETSEPDTVPAPLLARLLYVVGHIAIRLVVYLDTVVYNELKRRNALRDMKKGKKGKKGKQNRVDMSVDTHSSSLNGTGVTPSSASRTLRSKESSVMEDNGEEALEGATADDADAEFVNAALDNDIVKGNGLLTKFIPLVLDVCQHPEKYKDEGLQASAALTLSKMMTVSAAFCNESLQLLVTIMERSPFPGIRANILIGLTDLINRFPNEVEPWTSHLYGRLRDENANVRSTCVKMLSDLIMREMVRVKGQVSELALCIVDPELDIRQATRQFFKDLSQKGNALYNVMPDIISRLADPEINLQEDDFHIILKYLLGLLQKEKQVDSIIEKLCARFKLATTERQWRDLSYCLSLLQFNAKSIRRLIENLPLLKDKIHHRPVLKVLQNIIEQTKKKPEAKAACAELEEKIEQLLASVEDLEVDKDAEAMPPPPAPPRRRKPTKKSARPSSSDEEEDTDDSDDDDVFVKKGKGSRRKASKNNSSSGSDSDSESTTKTPAKRNTKSKSRRKTPSSATASSMAKKSRTMTPARSSARTTRRKI